MKTDGTTWCWGANGFGELGNTTNIGTNNPNPVPTQVGTDTTWTRHSAASLDTCGIKTDHTLWCWGYNYWGQLGNNTNVNTTDPSPVPTQVGTDTTWTRLSAGWGTTCGVKTDGTAWCWGANDSGQLGNSTNIGTNNPVPTQVGTG